MARTCFGSRSTARGATCSRGGMALVASGLLLMMLLGPALAAPLLMPGGGYIFASDHSIPDSVSLETFSKIVDTYRRAAAY